MLSRTHELGLGLALMLGAVLLLFFGIPYGVVSPGNVRSVFLAPYFWPNILSAILLLAAIVITLRAWMMTHETEGMSAFADFAKASTVLRILGFTVLLVVYFLAIPPLGMVPASVLAYLAMLAITGTSYRVIGILSAFLLPLALYAFFQHVAGVAVPQGHFVRLP